MKHRLTTTQVSAGSRKLPLIAYAVFLLAIFSSFSPAHAQNSNDHLSPAQQLVKETREAAGEDKGEFKHSSAVGWIAKATGLSIEQADWLSELINFGVIAAAIFWISKKNLPGFFRNRTAMIQKAMEDARKASEDANRRLAQIEIRLSKLGTEIAAMRSAAEKEAAEEEQRIKAAAEEDARKMVESVEQEIAAMAKTTRRELTAYAANLAVSLAKKQIHVDPATDENLISGFARQLSNGGERRKQ
jgi:F-type H+-transporting ATPase subunit b